MLDTCLNRRVLIARTQPQLAYRIFTTRRFVSNARPCHPLLHHLPRLHSRSICLSRNRFPPSSMPSFGIRRVHGSCIERTKSFERTTWNARRFINRSHEIPAEFSQVNVRSHEIRTHLRLFSIDRRYLRVVQRSHPTTAQCKCLDESSNEMYVLKLDGFRALVDVGFVDQDLPPSRLLTANDAQQFKHGRRLDTAHLASGQGRRRSSVRSFVASS